MRNSCVRYWIENKGTTRNDLQKLCAVLANNKETPWVNKLNSQARQSAADRAWQSITKFYSLPGLRLGYVLAHPERLLQWQRWRDPWSVNNLAVVAAIFFPTLIFYTGVWGLVKFWVVPWFVYHFYLYGFADFHNIQYNFHLLILFFL